MRPASLLACYLICAPAWAASWHGVAGTPRDLAEASAAAGNGRLTVCLTPSGRVSACKWPSPSYHDQLRYDRRSRALPTTSTEPWHGLMWGLRGGGETLWLSEAAWAHRQRYGTAESAVIETVSSLANRPVGAAQTLFVHPRDDLLVTHIEVWGLEAAPTLYWFANFSPCTRLVPELPVADWLLDGSNDFAAFADAAAATIYHFRPRYPGSRDWENARRWLLDEERPAHGDSKLLRNGVWIGYAGVGPVAAYQCGEDGEATCAFSHADRGALANRAGAVGQCNSAIAFSGVPRAADNAYEATVFVAFGENRSAVDAVLARAKKLGFDALYAESEEYWHAWLDRAQLPAAAPPNMLAACNRSLLTIAQCMDSDSAAVVRAPTTQPPRAMDWPRHGAWVTYALDLAGRHDLAERHIQFYLETIRREGNPGSPAGSLPAATFANGVESVPNAVLDIAGVAWTLWSFWQHSAFLEPTARGAYLERVWPGVDLAGAFLVHWSDRRTGAPLHSFDPEVWRDTQSDATLLAVYLGVNSARDMAKALGHPRPDWDKRELELRALIRHRCVDEEGNWRLLPPWPIHVRVPNAPGSASWEARAAECVAALTTLRGEAAASAICNLAVLWQENPDKLAMLRPHLETAVLNALYEGERNGSAQEPSPLHPDALTAALTYIAVHTVWTTSE
ncbi:MAG TPA: hypothetical protein HPP77_06670 [Candidatus Hydrogenedentes bacterium]|nr:hypothetical protein [Candidatus Hydrogenedentota bacterium]